IARMQERKAQVDPAIIAESARWGDSKVATPFNKSDWQTEVNWLLNTYFPGRTNTVLTQLRADGLYLTPPALNLASGAVATGSMLSMSSVGNVAGTIYFTVGGVDDPRNADGSINVNAIAYS